jgi:F-type H+-transporting ATPase subunit epsilon
MNMPAAYGFQCTVITPERQVFDAAADFVALPAHDGEIGILQNRAPLLCKLGIGILRILTGVQTQRMFIDGGFAQMLDNELIILTARAATAEQIDPQAEEAALAAARRLRPTDPEAQATRRRDIERASAKLKLVR